MQSWPGLARLALVLWGAAALTAVKTQEQPCFKYEDLLRIMPDGSGKLEATITTGGSFDIEEWFASLQASKGLAGATKPSTKLVDGIQIVTFSLYFENVDSFTLQYEELRQGVKLTKKSIGLSASRRGDQATLVIEDFLFSWFDPMASRDGTYNKTEKETWNEVRPLLSNRIVRRVVVPGKIVRSDGFNVMRVDEVSLIWCVDTIVAYKDLEMNRLTATRSITYEPSEGKVEDLKKWREELNAIKQSWPREKLELVREIEAKKKLDGSSNERRK